MAERIAVHFALVLRSSEAKMKLRISPSAKFNATLKCLSVASLLTATLTAKAQRLDPRNSTEAIGIRFHDFLSQVNTTNDSLAKNHLVEDYVARLRSYGRAVIEDSTIYFLYLGNAKRVGVPGDINGWSPAIDTMTRIPKTNLFFLAKTIHPAARFEYKVTVDSIWMLDPLNHQQAMGGYGPNSEIWMPQYRAPKEIEYRTDVLHGRLDSLSIKSKLLHRTHPVFVYLPPGYRKLSRTRYPSIYVTDGGEYITLALMTNVLDNLIAEKRIPSIIAVFVDPRTDVRDSETSKRMYDYTMSDTFVTFMVEEVRARLLTKYRMDWQPELTGIMGASLGGLISTYAAFTRPDIFGLCAAQSPSFWWKNDSMITMIANAPKKNLKFYIDTGTIRDAQENASKMKSVMDRKGYQAHYEEHPEGHNWVNWRARISHILEYFWGTQ